MKNMSKHEVDFCGRPVWWPFINAFRYAIGRPNALDNVKDWLLANFDIIDHKATYLNQLIQDGSNAIVLDCFEIARRKTTVLLSVDIQNKIEFVERVIKLAKVNNIALGGYTKNCLESAKEAAKSADIKWPNEGSAGQ